MKTSPTADPTCPQCQSRLQRVRRSFADRCLSLFVPLARYRCAASACGWQGLLTPAPTVGRGHRSATSYRPRRVLEPSRTTRHPNAERRVAR